MDDHFWISLFGLSYGTCILPDSHEDCYLLPKNDSHIYENGRKGSYEGDHLIFPSNPLPHPCTYFLFSWYMSRCCIWIGCIYHFNYHKFMNYIFEIL